VSLFGHLLIFNFEFKAIVFGSNDLCLICGPSFDIKKRMNESTRDNKIYFGSIQMNLHQVSIFHHLKFYCINKKRNTRNTYAIPKL